MTIFSYTKPLILFFLLFFSGEKLQGQTTINSKHDSLNYISYPAFFLNLQKRDSIHFFYKPEWFENKKIDSLFTRLKLEDALSHVESLCHLSYYLIDKRSIVFVPFQTSLYNNPGTNYSDVLLIGNSNEYGRYAKATIEGKIKDANTEVPLAGVTVIVEKLKIATITDANGNFSLTLPVGDYFIKLNYTGYEENIKKIKLVSNGEANFEISEKSIKLQEVIITAERPEFNVTGTQMSLLSLNAKNIRELPVSLGEIDIVRSMSLLPGIQTAGDFGSGFYVRGGGTDQNLILIQDVPLFNPAHMFGLTSTINTDNVSSVTLLKAGIPARYGERASSIMNIRLGADSTKTIKVKGGIGLLESRLNIQIPFFENRVSLLLGGRSSYSDWLLHKFPDVDLKNSSASFYDLNVLCTLNINPDNKIIIFGYYSKDNFGFSKITNYAYSNVLSSIRWNHRFNTKLSLSAIAGLSKYEFSVSDMDTLHRPDAYQIKLNTQYSNLKCNFSWLPDGRHSIDFGINGVMYNIMPGNELPYGSESLIKPFKVESEKGLELAEYISDNFDILPKLNTEVGLRYIQYLSLGPGSVLTFSPDSPRSLESIIDTLHYKSNQIIHQYSGIEPRIAFRYRINDVSSIKWSYNRINQFIHLISNNTVISPTDTWTLSDTYLKPLTSDQYAIGYFRNFAHNTYEVSAEAYYKVLKNVIEYKNGAQVFLNDHLETDMVNAKGRNWGIEFYARKSSGLLTGWVSYTYSRSMLRTTGTSTDEQINNNHFYPSNFDKPNNLVVNANYHISRRWRISGTFTYNTGRPVTLPELKYLFQGNQLIYYSDRNKYRLPDYHRLDIAISFDENLRLKKMWKGSWTLSVINVYGRKNAYSEYYAKEDDRINNSIGNTGLYKLYIIGIPLPTLTYNFIF
jgi:CarboxypepD_reg-like domain/TonB-dependent Receptor Plug Domain